jgi:hypothetical protein
VIKQQLRLWNFVAGETAADVAQKYVHLGFVFSNESPYKYNNNIRSNKEILQLARQLLCNRQFCQTFSTLPRIPCPIFARLQ